MFVSSALNDSILLFPSRQQIEFLQKERPELRNTTDWKHLYTSLRRRSA